MEGVTIIETSVLEKLIAKIEQLESTVKTTLADINNKTKPYLTTKEVCELLSKSENWVLLHKHELGYSKRTGTLIFKRKAIEEYIDEDYFKAA